MGVTSQWLCVSAGEKEIVEWFRGHLIEVRRGSDKLAAT